MKVHDREDVVDGENYFVVCEDGVVRYLVAEFSDGDFLEFAFYDVHGDEQYRTYNPHLIYTLE